jgi:hypothetical protein
VGAVAVPSAAVVLAAHRVSRLERCGLLDILGVVGNAVRLYLRNPSFVEPFTALPLAILPLFVVPIVIVSHVLLFEWVRARR